MTHRLSLGLGFLALVIGTFASATANELDARISRENAQQGVKRAPMPAADDLAFLRRIYVDLIARIPTEDEINEFLSHPADSRREMVIEKLMSDPRYVDRWAVFFEDMLRLRSNATGGAALIAFVHQAVEQNMPYDEMCRRLLTATGKAGKTPEVGFLLSDDAEPLAMASITSQVFMGVRIGCAQCHDHPFDKWKREDFYSLAAFFGKTRRVESQLTKVVYTQETAQSTVLWPPEGDAAPQDRKPMTPRFPFQMIDDNGSVDFLIRLAKLREPKKPKEAEKKGPSVDDLLADSDAKVRARTGDPLASLDLTSDAKRDIRKIDLNASVFSQSELRTKLAESITSPRNRQFARNIVNRVWKELIGRGFVEPVDEFRADNPPSHPATLDYLANEFIAHGFDVRYLVREIVTSDIYRRGRAPQDADDVTRMELETAFLATPMRRMISEALFDSIVVAGHLFEVKHPEGANQVVFRDKVRVPKDAAGKPGAKPKPPQLLANAGNQPGMAGMAGMQGGGATPAGYGLETAIEVDFAKVLADNAAADEVEVEAMRVMSREEVEAARMLQERMMRGEGVEYVDRIVERVVDMNPKFATALRVESPAPPGHFLRVFGQPNRSDLGAARDDSASMRQALMMLNGKLTHEASRVGPMEPMYALLKGDKPDVPGAIRLAYREIMTREPSADEMNEARQIVSEAANPVEGLADLRWVLLNCNEFRFLP